MKVKIIFKYCILEFWVATALAANDLHFFQKQIYYISNCLLASVQNDFACNNCFSNQYRLIF